MTNKSFKGLLKKLKQGPRPFDPTRFNDPLALQTAWSSNSRFDSEIRDNKLVRVNKHRLEFRVTFSSMLGPICFMSLSLFLLLTLYLNIGELNLLTASIPLLFVLLSAFTLYWSTIPAVFDKRQHFFWKCPNNPSRDFYNKTPNKNFCKLEEIHALQVISRDGVDDSGYELVVPE